MFITHKNKAFPSFSKLCQCLQNDKGFVISSIRTDYDGELENESFAKFCDEHFIRHNLLTLRTLQQNRVVERKNRTLEEMARTMLYENSLPKYFIINRAMIRSILKKTAYGLWKGKTPNVSFFHAFGCKKIVLNNSKDNLIPTGYSFKLPNPIRYWVSLDIPNTRIFKK